MKYELKKAKTEGVETLISGSSYGVNGIDYGYIDKAVNLSLGSQDLYYSLRGLYETCYANKNIKNIVLFTPSYYFFSDLSRTQNEDELTRVSKVYDLLFQDIHSCVLLPPKYDVLFKSEIFDIPFLMDLVVNQECSKGYFNSTLTRKSNATKT